MLQNAVVMLFELRKGSLHHTVPSGEYFMQANHQDWQQCYDIASKQGVLALAWDGVELLPQQLQPPKQLKFRWAISVEKYEARHRKYCKTVQDLQIFYKENGIVAVQMKGVGFSHGYNKPHHREGGDIDIFTYSADTTKMSHREANYLSDKLMEQQGIEVDNHSYKHSNFIFKGIPVENHKMFVNVKIKPKFFSPLNSLLEKLLNPTMVQLYNGEYNILVPSPQFNTLFISCHAFQHYGSGIALHHLYDWAALLKNYGLDIPDEITNTNFLRGVAAFTHLSNKYLGTEIDLTGFPDGYKEMSDEMLKEMLHPIYSKRVPYSNKIQILAYKTRKVLRSAKLASDVFGVSFFGRLGESLLFHIKKPSTIFERGDKYCC